MKCKYYNKCEHASSSALTCTENGGGTYCGKYRTLSAASCGDPQIPFLAQPFRDHREMLA